MTRIADIRTERLRLRKARPDDLAAFHSILSDDVAMTYWSSMPHTDLEQSRIWLQGMIDIPPDEGEDFVVEHEGRVVGKAGLYRFPEIGFIFHPDCWGRGFAAEALTPILQRAFERHGLDSVEADVDPRNRRSLGLLQKLGFREIGRRARTWLIGGNWCDSVDLRLLPSDFQASA